MVGRVEHSVHKSSVGFASFVEFSVLEVIEAFLELAVHRFVLDNDVLDDFLKVFTLEVLFDEVPVVGDVVFGFEAGGAVFKEVFHGLHEGVEITHFGHLEGEAIAGVEAGGEIGHVIAEFETVNEAFV